MNKLGMQLALALGALIPFAAAGGDSNDFINVGRAPEPETLALIAVGAVALIIVKSRRRK